MEISPRERGRLDCSVDNGEGTPFASIGGIKRRKNPKTPDFVQIEDEDEYLAGYFESAKRWYGAGFRTCAFAWSTVAKLMPIGLEEEED